MKLAKYIVLLAIILAVGYIYSQKLYLTNPTLHKYLYYSQCNTPIAYRIGSIDKQFELSDQQLSQMAKEATQVWNKAAKRELFVEQAEEALTINLVFDERQALSNQLSNLENKLSQGQNQIKPKLEEYEQKVAEFKTRVQNLNSKINEWNEKGGAPPDEYQKLKDEQEALQEESKNLNTMAKTLNRSADQYNNEVGQYNTTVNTFNQALEFKPEEGLYIPQENKINIYFNNTRQELVHTLAHELGHALGLDHNTNKLSIMYPYTNQEITASAEDTQGLEELCKEQSIISNYQTRLEIYLQYLQQVLQTTVSIN